MDNINENPVENTAELAEEAAAETTEEIADETTEETAAETVEETPDAPAAAGEAEVNVVPAGANKKPKKRKALRIVLIIPALLLVLVLAGGIAVAKMLGNLGNIKPTQGDNGVTGEAVLSSDESGSVISDGVTDTASRESFSSQEGTSGTEEPSAASPEQTTALPGEEPATAEDTVSADSGKTEDTTKPAQTTAPASQPAGQNEGTTAEGAASPSTTAPDPEKPETTTAAPVPVKSEYDIYRSGCFHMTGTVTDADGTAPMELAVTPDSLYMTSELDGVSLGVLVSGKKTYLMYPQKKCYMEMNSFIMSMLGDDADELFSAEDMGFNRMVALTNALSVSEEKLGNVLCKKYLLPDGENFCYVYTNGNKLVRIQALDKNKKIESTIDFISVSETVPADKTAPSSSYEKLNMFEFVALLGDVIA